MVPKLVKITVEHDFTFVGGSYPHPHWTLVGKIELDFATVAIHLC